MYTRELIFDTTLNAFYKNDFQEMADSSPYVADYILTPTSFVASSERAVVDQFGEIVTDNDEAVVTINRVVQASGRAVLRYLILRYPVFTVGMFKDFDFRDWRSADGVGMDAEAFMLTGHETLGDASKMKQAPYITTFFERTETAFVQDLSGGMRLESPSSCKMQVQWDFANSPKSNKFGPEQQVYRLVRHMIPEGDQEEFDNGYSVVTTKNKVKGRGRAMSILFKSDPDHDLRLLGWGVKFLGNENV